MRKLLVLFAAALALSAPARPAGGAEPEWSSAFERFLAPHWVADAAGGAADEGRRFLVACDPALGSYLRSLRELAELRAEYRRDPQSWAQGRHANYTCIARNSLRLPGPTNLPLPQRADPDEEGLNEGYYRVLREDAGSQLIELHYRDRNTGIYDSFYRYEVRGERVIPLESWVWGRGNLQSYMAAALALALLLCGALAARTLLRLMAKRRGEAGGRGLP